MNMSKSERVETIINLIQKRNFISPLQLSQEMGVSLITIRRDLKLLTEKNIIKKEYNNIRMVKKYNKIFHERHNNNLNSKKIIAELTQRFIQSEDTLFLDSSTTCYELAHKLTYSQKNLFIVTNNFYTAIELLNGDKIDVLLIGGKTMKGYYSTVGPLAEEMITNIKVDKCFFSCTAVDTIGTYEASNLEASIKLKFLENSKLHYLLIDSSKFNKASISKTTSLNNIEVLISEKELPANLMNVVRKNNIKCIFPSNK